jgi:hypothetical protein
VRCKFDVEAEEMRVISHLVSVRLAEYGVKTLTFTSNLPLRSFFPISREQAYTKTKQLPFDNYTILPTPLSIARRLRGNACLPIELRTG